MAITVLLYAHRFLSIDAAVFALFATYCWLVWRERMCYFLVMFDCCFAVDVLFEM